MNAPATREAFLALVRKSGIVDDKRLAAYLEKNRLAAPLPSEPHKLAELLVRDGLLTHFQAEQFLQGRWRRFTIGKYKVLERIGAGGMGSVFLCEHKLMRRRVAVKVLPTSQSRDPSALQRFYREARAVAALDHPNIVRAYDVDQEDNLHFLVMEYVDGSSLQEIVQRVGALDPIRAAHYISQAALGLQHAHEVAGLVHRDIKPGNIVVDRSGTVKVLDLGLARFFLDEEDLLTKQYDENVLGTADYLAPEQALDSHSVDIRGDIYSLGGTFYFCLTGQTPFGEGTVAQKLIWHQSRQPKPLAAFRSDVPDGIVAIIARMMAKDPEQRYQRPIEVAQALAPWTQQSIPPPSEVEMPRLSRAARGSGAGEIKAPAVGPAPAAPLSARSRKVWQVPSSSSTQANLELVPEQSGPTQPPTVPRPCPLKPRGEQPLAAPPSDAPPLIAQQEKAAAPPLLPAELKLAEAEEHEPAAQPQDGALASQEEDSLPWPPLAAETERLTAQADTDPHTPKKAAARRPHRAKAVARARQKYRRRRLWWGSLLGGGLLVFAAILTWAVLPRHTQPVAPPPATRPPLFVSHSGKQAFRTLSEALRQAEDKDHIVAADDLEEQLELTGSKKELVIEPAPGRPVVWRFPRNVASANQLLLLDRVANLRIRGFRFDGRNRVDQIFTLKGPNPGVTLEDLQLQGFRRHALVLANVAGTEDRPVTLDRVQAPATKTKDAALLFLANAGTSNSDLDRHIIVRDCRFEGPYKATVQVLGDASALKGVEFLRNVPTSFIQDSK